MGFRTVVVLNNDRAHEWEKDPELGHKIFIGANSQRDDFQYGTVLECVHADVETLAILDGYSGRPVAATHWYQGQTNEDVNLALLKEFADKMGYRVSKKPTKKV
jgi:hypothetical protein